MPARMGDSAPFSAPYVKLWLLCRTPLCAPRFAFHVHAFQTRSFRCFPLYGDFPVGPSGAFPSAEISPSVHPTLPLCEDSPAARPAFPVSEATPACASALRPWTIPCAPRFAFHVHTSQANSRPLFPPLRRFPRRFIWRFPSVKILPPPARLFPCWKLHRPALLRCAPGRYPKCLALPSISILFRHVPSGASPL